MGKLLLGLLLIGACATTAAQKRDVEARLASAQTDSERGQVYYEISCQRCHALYMPSSYTASEWRYYVDKYGRRARLRKGQKELVLQYLAGAARSRS